MVYCLAEQPDAQSRTFQFVVVRGSMLLRVGVACVVLLCNCAPINATANEIDSEHLFGFTEGSDIGARGDKELELSGHGRFGARGGRYSAVSTELEGKFTLLDNFRIAPGFSLAHYNIVDVPGLEDRKSGAVEGVSIEMKYRVLDRQLFPIGLTLGITPNLKRVDGASGVPIDGYGVDFFLLADKELIPGRLFGAFNVIYDPAATQSRLTGEWTRDASLQLSGAAAAQIARGVFVGGEVRYARAYAGLGLSDLSGHALFVGPTFYAQFSKTTWLSVGWNIQVAGRSVEERSSPDLVNFQRNEVIVRFGHAF